jgi:hypothetical protein
MFKLPVRNVLGTVNGYNSFIHTAQNVVPHFLWTLHNFALHKMLVIKTEFNPPHAGSLYPHMLLTTLLLQRLYI